MVKRACFVFIAATCLLFISNHQVEAQFTVKVDQDTILAGDQEAKIIVSPSKGEANLNCVSRKGGGNFSDFKTVQSTEGSVSQATFTSPFPGEVEIDVLDGKFNKIGKTNITVVAPTITVMEEKSVNSIDWQNKTMPLYVRVTDHRDNLVKTASLKCRLTEIVGKKVVSTTSKVTEFVLRADYYEATITGLKDASYRLEVIDVNHLEAFDALDNPDNPHPSTVIEGLNISF
ncbi:hypothetical protein JNL27_00445 [bacterium]|nr:hypothetical protein [bacterium]